MAPTPINPKPSTVADELDEGVGDSFPALQAVFDIFVCKLIMVSLVQNLSSKTVKQTCQIFIHMLSKHTPSVSVVGLKSCFGVFCIYLFVL